MGHLFRAGGPRLESIAKRQIKAFTAENAENAKGYGLKAIPLFAKNVLQGTIVRRRVSMERKRSILALAALLLISGAAILRATPADGNSRYGANYFPNVPLTTQDGKTVHFYDDLLKGKIVAIDLIYTHCEYSCPLETARMAQVQRILGDRVGKDIFFYSISIDPRRDTPAELKAYAKKYHAGPGWLFLTGKKSDIDLVAKKLGLYADPSINQDGHTTYLMIGDEPNGQWMQNSAVDNPKF